MAWTCPCGANNGDDLTACRKCSRPLRGWHETPLTLYVNPPPVPYQPSPPPNYPPQQQQNWNQPPPAQYSYPPPPNYYPPQPRPFACHTCHEGTMVPKKVFRLSGPSVVIGFLLLIPSVIGILGCAVVFCGSIFYTDSGAQSVSDANFRLNCLASVQQTLRLRGTPVGPSTTDLIEQTCECVLAEEKQTGASEAMATQICAERMNRGEQFPLVTKRIRDFYSASAETSRDISIAKTLGGGLSLFWAILFFISGLLGWLLVMRKRVLQCSLCGAVVNAS